MSILLLLLTATGATAAFVGGVNWLAGNPPTNYVEEEDEPGCLQCTLERAFDPNFEQQCQEYFDKYQKRLQELAEQPAPNLYQRTIRLWEHFLTQKVPLAYKNLRLHILEFKEALEDSARKFCRRSIAQQTLFCRPVYRITCEHHRRPSS